MPGFTSRDSVAEPPRITRYVSRYTECQMHGASKDGLPTVLRTTLIDQTVGDAGLCGRQLVPKL